MRAEIAISAQRWLSLHRYSEMRAEIAIYVQR